MREEQMMLLSIMWVPVPAVYSVCDLGDLGDEGRVREDWGLEWGGNGEQMQRLLYRHECFSNTYHKS